MNNPLKNKKTRNILIVICIFVILWNIKPKTELQSAWQTQKECDKGDYDFETCIYLGCVYNRLNLHCYPCFKDGETITIHGKVLDYPFVYPKNMCCSGCYKESYAGLNKWTCLSATSCQDCEEKGGTCAESGTAGTGKPKRACSSEFSRTIADMVKSFGIMEDKSCHSRFMVGLFGGFLMLILLISNM